MAATIVMTEAAALSDAAVALESDAMKIDAISPGSEQ